MKIHYNLEELRGIKNPVVTTGSFDGVHVGHKVILRRLIKLAQDTGGETVLITFYPHPRRVLYPDTEGKDLMMINTQREKKWLLKKTGLDHLMVINFTKEFSRLSSKEFIEKVLVGILNARIVVVGFNHYFGYHREGNFEYLYKLGHMHGFDVEEIPEQDIHNESVSSTKIRNALLQGNIQRANAYLDHYYIIKTRLSVNRDLNASKGIVFYNVVAEEEDKLIPPDGVYAVNVEGENIYEKGMVLIDKTVGIHKTPSECSATQLHILSNNKIQEGQDVTVYFLKQIRSKSRSSAGIFHEKQMKQDLKVIGELIF